MNKMKIVWKILQAVFRREAVVVVLEYNPQDHCSDVHFINVEPEGGVWLMRDACEKIQPQKKNGLFYLIHKPYYLN